MKKTQVKKGPPSTDLLVCFPTRSHLTMMPKMICSTSSVINLNHSHHHHGKSGGGDHGGLWSKKNPMGSDLSEPTSPKVTCVGQIKARPKSRSCKNWHSVMEEIERIHNNKKYRKKPSWGDAIGFKKESMQFLTCLRSFKFDLGCFGAFPNANVTSDDDDDDDDNDSEANCVKKIIGFGGNDHDHKDEHSNDHEEDTKKGLSRSAFSKWLMVLEGDQDCLHENEETIKPKDGDDEAQAPCVPPSNALLLMRCRSAPTKGLSEKEKEDDDDDDNDEDEGVDHDDQHDHVIRKRENLMELMKYEGDFYKLSCDIAKETWVVGGINKDSSSRTQTSKKCSIECLQEVKACLQ